MQVIVRTFEISTGKMELQKTIDYENDDQFRWLDKHLTWAFENQRGVQLMNLADLGRE